jgi:hypothetical protein
MCRLLRKILPQASRPRSDNVPARRRRKSVDNILFLCEIHFSFDFFVTPQTVPIMIMMRLSFKLFLLLVTMVDILGSAALDVTTNEKASLDQYPSDGGGRSLYEYGVNDQDRYYHGQEISYEELQDNQDFQEWKESQLTEEDRQKQQEEEEKRQQEYRQQEQEYQEQLMQQEMELYQEYLAWKNETTWKNETSYGYNEMEDSSTSGLSFVDSNVLLEGRQWTIGSSMLLVGMLAGFGAAMVIMQQKNKKTANKARPLMDDPNADIA